MKRILCKISLERGDETLFAYAAVPINDTVEKSDYLDYIRDFLDQRFYEYDSRYNEIFEKDISTDLLSVEILTGCIMEF